MIAIRIAVLYRPECIAIKTCPEMNVKEIGVLRWIRGNTLREGKLM